MKKVILIILSFVFILSYTKAQWIGVNTSLTSSGDHIRAFGVNGSSIFASDGWNEYMFVNDGSGWTSANNGITGGTTVDAFAVCGSDIYAAIEDHCCATVYRSTNNGFSWINVNNGLPINTISSLGTSGYNIFAGTYSGVYLSTNNGSNWIRMNNGLTDTLISSLIIIGNNVFAGTIQGGVFMSSNNGSNWTAVNSGLTYNHIYALANYGNNIFASAGNGISNGVYLSTNNGSNWSLSNSGLPANNYVLSFAVSGNNIFAGTLSQGVFFSVNNGNSWSPENTGLTNMQISALAISGSNIFAGSYVSTNSSGIFMRPLSDITGILINDNQSNFVVYPNPAKNIISVNLQEQKANQNHRISIYNVEGQKIFEKLLKKEKNEIDISGLAKGIYIIKLINDNRTEISKFVKE